MPINTLAIDASRMIAGARTGTENYSVNIIRELAALPNVPTIQLYARAGHPIAPVPGVPVNVSGPGRLWTHLGLSRAMRRDRPDALFVPSHVVPVVHPQATVVTVHDLGYLHEPEAHPRKQRLMLDRTTRWNVRAASRIVAISGQTRDDLIERYNANPERVRVVHHGVDHERYQPCPKPDDREILARYGISSPFLLFVSTVQPRKNVIRLVQAFETLDIPDLSLVIAGKSGWLSDPIEAAIRNSRCASRILRAGYLPDEDLPAIYRSASVFVLPSLFEGFGMGVLEAMASGTAVVTSHTGSLAEVAGNTAVLVNPESVESIAAGINRALDPETARRLREQGLERARQFTWRSAAARTLQVIEEAFDEA